LKNLYQFDLENSGSYECNEKFKNQDAKKKSSCLSKVISLLLKKKVIFPNKCPPCRPRNKKKGIYSFRRLFFATLLGNNKIFLFATFR